MERIIQAQTTINEALDKFVSQLSIEFENLSTYQMMMETQLAQIPKSEQFIWGSRASFRPIKCKLQGAHECHHA